MKIKELKLKLFTYKGFGDLKQGFLFFIVILSLFFFLRLACNGLAIKQVAEGNLPEGRSDRRERSFIACWALLNGA